MNLFIYLLEHRILETILLKRIINCSCLVSRISKFCLIFNILFFIVLYNNIYFEHPCIYFTKVDHDAQYQYACIDVRILQNSRQWSIFGIKISLLHIPPLYALLQL